jgi:large subunit ribosomal protein L25
MSKFSITAEVRSDLGKEKVKKLRFAGQIPAVVYGAGEEPVSLTLNTRDAGLILKRIRGEKVMVDLSYGEKTDSVFVRAIQRDPVDDELLHVDFYRLDLKVEIDTRIPIHPVGTPIGISRGGILEQGLRELSIHGLPGAIPPHFDVDVNALDVDQSIHVADLAVPEGIKIITPSDSVVFLVKPKLVEVVEGEATATAEEEAPEA